MKEKDEQKVQPKSVIRKVLEDAVNGDKIIRNILDNQITETNNNTDALNHLIKVDFSAILDPLSNKQTTAVFDLLDLRIERGFESREPFTNLIKHPVIGLFITQKWKKTQSYFYFQSIIYICFLLSYSAFIINLFNRPEVYCSSIEKVLFGSNNSVVKNSLKIFSSSQESNEYCRKYTVRLSKKFMTEFHESFIICELCLLIFFTFLFMLEIYQAIKLRKQYFKELENYIEWVVLLCAGFSMFFMNIMHQDTKEAAFVRGVASLGICAAWLELIFIIGRYPFRGGDFSIMFYNIIKILAKYLSAMFLMIIGFAFAFMIVNFGHDQESFENPIKSSIKTLTMALGEFNFEDMYNIFKEDSISRGFSMILLVLLILFGTITMVNLFIAVVISDIKQLNEDVFTQNLINMAQCSILVEELMPVWVLNNMMVEDSINICIHSLCPKSCRGKKLPPNMKPLLEALKKISKDCLESARQSSKRSSVQIQTFIEKNNKTDKFSELTKIANAI